MIYDWFSLIIENHYNIIKHINTPVKFNIPTILY